MQTTEDRFLGGDLLLSQPAKGFRAGSDAVLLAAAVPARAAERALELGCGVGAATLCLARRVGGVAVTGLEIQPELARLARRNAAANGLADRVTVLAGDLDRPPAVLTPGGFDQVFANPPYFEADRSQPPPDPARAAARTDVAGGLGAWVDCLLAMARPGGRITVIQRAERLAELEGLIAVGAGDLRILPLLSDPARPAKRVLLQAVKGAAGPPRRLPGFLLHRAGGGYTAAAEAILREAAPLPIAA